MATAINVLTKVQIGKETTPGTAVAATRRIVIDDATFTRVQELDEFDGQNHGLLARAVTTPLVVMEGSQFRIQSKFDFTQFLWMLLSSVKGGVTPTTPGAGEARLWTFAPPVTSGPAPTTYTLEFAQVDAAASPNTDGLRCPYVICKSWELNIPEKGIATMSGQFFGRKVTDTAPTSLSLPSGLVYAPALRASVFIDESWAGLGGTQISGQVFNTKIAFESGLREEYYSDGRSALDFSNEEVVQRSLDVSFDVVVNPASGKLVPTEKAKKTAGSTRFARIQLDGAAFAAPDASLSHYLKLDLAGTHATDSLSERGGERNGLSTIRVHLKSIYDATGAADLSIALQNKATAFP